MSTVNSPHDLRQFQLQLEQQLQIEQQAQQRQQYIEEDDDGRGGGGIGRGGGGFDDYGFGGDEYDDESYLNLSTAQTRGKSFLPTTPVLGGEGRGEEGGGGGEEIEPLGIVEAASEPNPLPPKKRPTFYADEGSLLLL